jgi:hypothetical protein
MKSVRHAVLSISGKGPLHDGGCRRASSDPTSLEGIIPVDVLARKYKKD